MIEAEAFCSELELRGFAKASGVPCSFFGGPIAYLSRTPGRYVPAANEGNALAIAVGAALAGERRYVMLQNSGLGNLINPLTSLVMTYRIPVLTFVSLRGWPDPSHDEPQHEVMGTATKALLEMLSLPHWILRADATSETFTEILDAAETAVSKGEAPFVLVEKGAVGKVEGPEAPEEDRLNSAEVIGLISELAGDAPVIATTGYTGRELFGLDDRPRNFYMQGSMGHASSIALGVAMSRPRTPVIVLDGDGAALMHLGALSVIGDQAPRNLVHVVLDNGMHESTGGQSTTSAGTALEGVAAAAGYASATRSRSADQVREHLNHALSTAGPHLLVVPTRPRSGPMPPRATATYAPETMRDRFAHTVQAASPMTAR